MKNRKSSNSLSIFYACTDIYIALLLTIFLFYTGTHGYQGILAAKFSAFLAICGGYAGLMILLLLESVLIGYFRLPPLNAIFSQSSWPQRLLVAYLVITWISAVLSPNWPATIIGVSRCEGALTITLYCVCFLFISIFGRIEKWMLPLFAAAVFVFDCICIIQLYGGNPFALYPEGYNYFDANVDYGGAYLGTIGNVDLVSAFLCIAIPILWIAILRGKDQWKYWLIFPLATSLVVLIKMWVLAGLVGIFVGSVLSLCVVLQVPPKAKKLLWGVVAGCAVISLLVVFFIDLGSGFLHEIHELLHGRIRDSFGSGRIYIWKSILNCVPAQLLLGSGPDTMALAGFEPFTRFDETLNVTIVAQIDIAHNEYLNILYHQGIFAFLAYFAVIVSTAKKWLLHSSQSGEVAALGGAVLCYCIQAFFGFSMCIIAPYFWAVLALLNGNSLKGGNLLC